MKHVYIPTHFCDYSHRIFSRSFEKQIVLYLYVVFGDYSHTRYTIFFNYAFIFLLQSKKRKLKEEQKKKEHEAEKAKDEQLTKKRQREERKGRYREQDKVKKRSRRTADD